MELYYARAYLKRIAEGELEAESLNDVLMTASESDEDLMTSLAYHEVCLRESEQDEKQQEVKPVDLREIMKADYKAIVENLGIRK